MKKSFVFIFFVLQAHAYGFETPVVLLDKEGELRCKIADTEGPAGGVFSHLRECDEMDALYAGMELNPEEIRAAAVVPPGLVSKKALAAAGVYVVGLLTACPAGHVAREYLGKGFWGNFVGGVGYLMAAMVAFESLVPVTFMVRVIGILPVGVSYAHCHGYIYSESKEKR